MRLLWNAFTAHSVPLRSSFTHSLLPASPPSSSLLWPGLRHDRKEPCQSLGTSPVLVFCPEGFSNALRVAKLTPGASVRREELVVMVPGQQQKPTTRKLCPALLSVAVGLSLQATFSIVKLLSSLVPFLFVWSIYLFLTHKWWHLTSFSFAPTKRLLIENAVQCNHRLTAIRHWSDAYVTLGGKCLLSLSQALCVFLGTVCWKSVFQIILSLHHSLGVYESAPHMPIGERL